MQYFKRCKKYIASLLAIAMLMSTFTPSLQTIFAQDHDQEVGISEVVKEQTLEKNQERVNEVTSKIDETGEVYTLTIHYHRNNQDYEGWNIHTWSTGVSDGDYEFTSEDDFGKIATFDVKEGSTVGYIIKKGDWEDKNHSEDQVIQVNEDMEIWVTEGQNGYTEYEPNLDALDETPINLVVHYERENQDYDNFRLYTWGTSDDTHQDFDYDDSYGKTKLFSFESLQDVKKFGFIIYKEVENQEWHENKDGGDKKNINLDQLKLITNVDRYVAHIYVKEGSDQINYENPNEEIGAYSTVTLHFNRQDDDYTNWDVWTWSTGAEDGAHGFEHEDDFGRVVEIKVKTGNTLGYIVRKSDWSEKNYSDDQTLKVLGNTEIWVNEGQNGFDVVGPNGNRQELPQAPVVDVVPDEEAELQIFVHYYRYLEDYKNWNVWAWGDGQEGYGYPFVNSDEFGQVAKINLKDLNQIEKIGFIIRKGEWSEKDIDKDRFIDLTKAVEVNGKKQLHVYLLQGEEMVYYTPDIDKTTPLSGATFTDLNALKVTAPIPFENTEGVTLTDKEGNSLEIEDVKLNKDKKWLNITLKQEIEVGEAYYIKKEGFKSAIPVQYYGVYDSDAFNELFYYEGDDLGANYSASSTTFKVWAPTAQEVSLQLYRTGHKDDLYQESVMTKGDKGVWELKVDGDLNGVYYTYQVTVGDNTEVAVDPYARTVGVNGLRGMVVDLDTTDPTNWLSDVSPEFSGEITDAIIYELHIRDLSSAANSGIKNVGKYLGLTETGTKNDEGLATGLDHLKEMGITHLHLLPSFDHRSIDETKLDEAQFNWGYDPQNYNSPEGSYSTDPYNGEVRVNEFKQMVQSLHENDIRVVMDVVYNHTGSTADSDFNKIVPGYYYRQNENGSFSDGSGCGNETASERLMMRKFMIDSVTYWVNEYHVDGFRFDLMALHDVETMNALEEALHDIDPNIIIYGEGWTGGGSPLPDEEAAYKGNAKETPNIAYFNDDMRDAIKGNVGNDWEAGYINGNTTDYFYERLKFGIVGSIYHNQVGGEWIGRDWAANPSQSISYVSAHDNNTLYDKLLGVQKAANGDTSVDYIKGLQKQANAIVLTGQGIPFLHAGVEMMRSKAGNHNSYNSPDEVNQIDWSLKSENQDVVDYYKGLIELRKSNKAFRLMTQEEVQENLTFNEKVDEEVVAFILNSYEKSADKIAVIHNVSDEVKTVSLGEAGKWSIVVNGEEAGVKELELVEGDQVEVAPHASYVLMLNYTELTQPETPGTEKPETPETEKPESPDTNHPDSNHSDGDQSESDPVNPNQPQTGLHQLTIIGLGSMLLMSGALIYYVGRRKKVK